MEADLDRPSRGDWYLMQIAAEIYRSYAKGEARKIKLSNMQLKRVNTDPSSETVTKQQASKIATARWFGALGIKRSK